MVFNAVYNNIKCDLSQQIIILQLFLKDLVTPKTGVFLKDLVTPKTGLMMLKSFNIFKCIKIENSYFK